MQKMMNSFKNSYNELKNVHTITISAMFAAISVILGYFTLVLGDFIKIGFSGISNQIVYYLFGPFVGGFFGGMLDILKYIIKPTGAFFPGFTVTAMIAGIIYGLFYYKKQISFRRVLAAELIVSVICNMILGTLWLTMLYNKGFLAILPMRVLKNLIMWPINSICFYSIVKSIEVSGIMNILKRTAQ